MAWPIGGGENEDATVVGIPGAAVGGELVVVGVDPGSRGPPCCGRVVELGQERQAS